MVEVTNGGTVCTEYADCLAKLQAGEDIDYDGQSGPIAFDENGDPSLATMGVYEYGADNTYSASEFIEGEVPSAS
jgi:branched-chain amino acid transport system substrate-binding protein